MEKSFNFQPTIAIPPEATLNTAKKLLSSNDVRVVAISKALIDATEAGQRFKLAMTNQLQGTYDLGEYLDFYFADALDFAKVLKDSSNDEIRKIAQILIAQNEAIVESKESFLKEQKRLGLKPR